jgi:predicted phage terminase large subunit-like protein
MGIIKRGWWQVWDKPMFPPLDYIIASVDTAYTEKTENDFSAMTVWGVFTRDPSSYALRQSSWGGNVQELRTYSQQEVAPSVILIHAWAEHLAFSDLVRKIAEECIKWKVTKLLVENKAAGMPVATELRRLYSRSGFSVQLDDPGSTDKMARLYSVQHLFEDGIIYAPDMTWADDVIVQCMRFPKAKHDDLVDCVSMALRYLRRTGLIMRAQEVETDYSESVLHRGPPPPPLYGV